MKVYIELIFILNIWIDFLLLLSETLILKKKTSIKRIIISSTIGSSLSIIMLINNNVNFINIYRFIISVIMLLISFNFNDIKTLIQDVIYFYMVSIILAGFIYLVKENITPDTFISNFLVLTSFSPFFMYFYVKMAKKEKNLYNKLYNIEMTYKGCKYNFVGFLDTGNKLYDQYKHRPIILVYSPQIRFSYKEGILVPFETSEGNSIIKCIIPERIIIDGNEIKNVLIGLNNKEFNIERVDAIIHSDVIGG